MMLGINLTLAINLHGISFKEKEKREHAIDKIRNQPKKKKIIAIS